MNLIKDGRKVTVYAMNSAMMPDEGVYTRTDISREEFCEYLKIAQAAGVLKSAIGYEQNAQLIDRWAGIRLDVNRTPVQNPATKGQPVSASDFEFALVS